MRWWLGLLCCVQWTVVAEAKTCSDIQLRHTIDAAQLWQDLSRLAADDMAGRETGTPGNEKARAYIAERFAQIGLLSYPTAENYLHPFSLKSGSAGPHGINLLGYLPGDGSVEDQIVITAHYDHIGQRGSRIFNGADDNASGVAAMLAIATAIRSQSHRHAVVFAATDAEEQGLKGARAMLRNGPLRPAQVKANLNLDMLAQGGYRRRLYLYGARYHPPFKSLVSSIKQSAGLCVRSHRRSTDFGILSARRVNWRQVSDHGVFHRAGIPFLFIGVDEHPFYHTENDTVARVERDFFTAAAETSLATFQLMDKL